MRFLVHKDVNKRSWLCGNSFHRAHCLASAPCTKAFLSAGSAEKTQVLAVATFIVLITDYVKDGDSCIYDVCGSMKNYCKNGGSCVNTMHHGAGKPVPLCICPPNRTGLQCETYREAPTTTTTSTTTTTPRPLGSPIPRRHPEVGTRIEPAEHYPSHQNFAEPDLINNRPMRISGYQPVLEQPTTDRVRFFVPKSDSTGC